MLVSKVPFRISFFGGGTDFPEYFNEYGGSVISTTIDKYCYVTMRHLPPYFSYQNQLTYSKIERFNSPDELQHPLVREAMKFLPVERLQISYDADLPACTGLGTSSSFAVALLAGFHHLRKESFTKEQLWKEAINLERNILGEAGGWQDQVAVACGGFNRIDFSKDGVKVTPLNIKEETLTKLQNNLFLFFTGFTRFSGEIAREQKQNISLTVSHLNSMKDMVDEAQQFLEEGDVDSFGRMLDRSWEEKKQLSSQISNGTIDMLYSKAKLAGATGGKILGAGGGGFMLLYVPEENRENFVKSFSTFEFVPFGFEKAGASLSE